MVLVYSYCTTKVPVTYDPPPLSMCHWSPACILLSPQSLAVSFVSKAKGLVIIGKCLFPCLVFEYSTLEYNHLVFVLPKSFVA